jgi:hypothetical protein
MRGKKEESAGRAGFGIVSRGKSEGWERVLLARNGRIGVGFWGIVRGCVCERDTELLSWAARSCDRIEITGS